MSLKFKFISAFILALLLTSVSVAYFTFDMVRDISVDNQINNMSNVVNLIDINLTTRNRSIGNTLRTASESRLFQTLLDADDAPVLEGESARFLNELFQEIGSVTRMTLFSGGRALEIRRGADPQIFQAAFSDLTSVDAGFRSFLEKVLVTDYPVFGGLSESVPGTRDRNSYILAGSRIGTLDQAVICEINTDAYYNILPVSLDLLRSQTTYILDQSGRVISSNRSVESSLAQAIEQYGSGLPNQFWYDSGQERYHVQKQYNGLTGWRSYAIISEDRFFPEGSLLRSFLINFGVVSSLFSVLLFGLFTGRITNPLKKLTSAMSQAQNGDYSIRVDETRADEIGELNRAYNYLLDEINRLIHQVYEEKLALKNAELNALQAQINPHFIYNSLDSINWMLIDKGDYESSRIIQSLGKILRYSIDTHTAFVPLREEVENVENYLIIQKNRFEDQLRYQIAIPEAIRDYQVPRLILQPLVENSIKHGMRTGSHVLFIEIHAELTQTLRLIVRDNGRGMTEETIRQVLRQTGPTDHPHIGLANVDHRIRLIYGEDCGVRIASQVDRGTEVSIELPGKER